METETAVTALGALAHDTRLDVFRILVKAGPQGLAAGAIADALGVPAPTLSFHLRELLQSGVVVRERQSRSLVYSANFEVMHELVGFLTEECCRGVD